MDTPDQMVTISLHLPRRAWDELNQLVGTTVSGLLHDDVIDGNGVNKSTRDFHPLWLAEREIDGSLNERDERGPAITNERPEQPDLHKVRNALQKAPGGAMVHVPLHAIGGGTPPVETVLKWIEDYLDIVQQTFDRAAKAEGEVREHRRFFRLGRQFLGLDKED